MNKYVKMHTILIVVSLTLVAGYTFKTSYASEVEVVKEPRKGITISCVIVKKVTPPALDAKPVLRCGVKRG
jgi:hypothetical protein